MTDSWTAQLASLVTSVPVTGLVAVALGVILLVKWLLTPESDTDIPPFPAKPYPFLGHLPYLAKDQRGTLLKWRKTVGNVYSLYLGPRLFIVMSGYPAIKEALITNAHAFSSRPEQQYTNNADFGVSFSNGDHWREQRTLSMTILKSFGVGKSSLASKIATEVTVYLDELSKAKCADVRYLTNVSVGNNICDFLVGRRFDYHDEFFVAFMETMGKMIAAADSGALSMIWPWLRHLPGNVLNSQSLHRHMTTILTNVCDRFIKETREAKEKSHSFISEYDKEMQNLSGTETTINDDNLRFVVMQIFVAGTDTVAISILWFMNFMIHHPEIQSKVYDEIVKTKGSDVAPDLEDRPKLPYTQAAINETLRLASVVPTNVPRRCDEDTIVQGYRIPAGATVLPSLDSVLWDEDLWENPMAFNPERFLNDSGDCTRPEEFIPFSLGRRMCLGDALAKMEMFLYVTSVIQRFEILPAEPTNLPTLTARYGALAPPENATFHFRDRKI